MEHDEDEGIRYVDNLMVRRGPLQHQTSDHQLKRSPSQLIANSSGRQLKRSPTQALANQACSVVCLSGSTACFSALIMSPTTFLLQVVGGVLGVPLKASGDFVFRCPPPLLLPYCFPSPKP
jgi:hypothetical protein